MAIKSEGQVGQRIHWRAEHMRLTVYFLFVNGIATIITVGGISPETLGIAKDALGSRPTGGVVTHETNHLVPLIPPASGEI